MARCSNARSQLAAWSWLDNAALRARLSELSDRRWGAADHVMLILRLAMHHECAGLSAPDHEAKAAIQSDRALVFCMHAKVDLSHSQGMPRIGQNVLEQPAPKST